MRAGINVTVMIGIHPQRKFGRHEKGKVGDSMES
jgi:hypothetical protein